MKAPHWPTSLCQTSLFHHPSQRKQLYVYTSNLHNVTLSLPSAKTILVVVQPIRYLHCPTTLTLTLTLQACGRLVRTANHSTAPQQPSEPLLQDDYKHSFLLHHDFLFLSKHNAVPHVHFRPDPAVPAALPLRDAVRYALLLRTGRRLPSLLVRERRVRPSGWENSR